MIARKAWIRGNQRGIEWEIEFRELHQSERRRNRRFGQCQILQFSARIVISKNRGEGIAQLSQFFCTPLTQANGMPRAEAGQHYILTDRFDGKLRAGNDRIADGLPQLLSAENQFASGVEYAQLR